MTFSKIAALFGAMLVLAMIPSLSVFAIVARSAALGFSHGLATVIGIVTGDLAFIIIAIYGLATVAENTSGLFIFIKYAGGIYLIWSGIKLIGSSAKTKEIAPITNSSRLSSFWSGLAITLGDQKAILFYLSFFPAFLDLNDVSFWDVTIVMAIAVVTVGGVKIAYAYLASRAKFGRQRKIKRGIYPIAGMVLIVTGTVLIFKN